MNVCSVISYPVLIEVPMARITDPEKLNRIKECTMDLIVRNGYSGITIAAIAGEAQVSAGYLYRHFTGKDELISTLVIENFETLQKTVHGLLDESMDITMVVQYYFRALFEIANADPTKARFISILYRDARFREEARDKSILKIPAIAERILRKGQATGEINAQTTVPEIMLFLLNLPIDYIFQRLEEKLQIPFTDNEVLRLAGMCMRALQ